MDRVSRLRQELSTTEVKPLSKASNPQLLPVCVHLDGLNAENTFHCWLYSVELCMWQKKYRIIIIIQK